MPEACVGVLARRSFSPKALGHLVRERRSIGPSAATRPALGGGADHGALAESLSEYGGYAHGKETT